MFDIPSREDALKQEQEIKRMEMQMLEEDAEVDISETINQPPIAISLGEKVFKTTRGVEKYTIPVGTYGNFSFIQAPPKSMKTYFIGILASAYLKGTNGYAGEIKGHRDGEEVIHFDTEQSKFHAQKVFRRPIDMNGSMDNGYHTYALRKMSFKDRISFIEYILYEKLNGKNIGLVIIDGVADLVSDVNNIVEANLVVQMLMKWTDELKCHIITVIHSNFGSDKPTGHLGSFLEKKTETQISLEKNTQNEGYVTASCKRSRSFPFEKITFKVNDRGLPEVLDLSHLNNLY